MELCLFRWRSQQLGQSKKLLMLTLLSPVFFLLFSGNTLYVVDFSVGNFSIYVVRGKISEKNILWGTFLFMDSV